MSLIDSAQPHVRFHPDCLLITDTTPRPVKPHFETRRLSLPLSWSRRPNEADLNDPTFTPNRPTKLMVKIPSFTRRTRVQSPERDSPLRGCLHSPSSPPRSIPIPLPPLSESAIEDGSNSMSKCSPPSSGLPLASPTEPLRSCCEACTNKMLLAFEENYVPKWSPGARRKKERDEKQASACPLLGVPSHIDAMLTDGYQPFIFGRARVDEVEVRRGKGAATKIDEETMEEDGSDAASSGPDSDPFERPKFVPPMSPTAEDRAFADMLPPTLSPSGRHYAPLSLPLSPPGTGQARRPSLSGRSSILQACLRGGSAVLKSVASGEGNLNIKLL